MAVFAVYIEKEVDYHGAMRPFGNTYHYSTQTGEPFPDDELARFVANEERLVTASDVRFVRYRTWGPTDGPIFDNVMREEGTLNYFGAGADPSGAYREACSLVVWPLPRSPVTNRRRWLRKFLRLGFGSGSAPGPTVIEGSAPLPADAIASLVAYGDAVRSPGALGLEDSLCTEDGAEPNGPTEVRPYLYTRQIGQ